MGGVHLDRVGVTLDRGCAVRGLPAQQATEGRKKYLEAKKWRYHPRELTAEVCLSNPDLN